MEAPIPLDAPVTIATLPASLLIVLFLRFIGSAGGANRFTSPQNTVSGVAGHLARPLASGPSCYERAVAAGDRRAGTSHPARFRRARAHPMPPAALTLWPPRSPRT